MTAPEFSRPESLDKIGRSSKPVHIEATAEERAVLSRRFGLVALDRLAADYLLEKDGEAIIARGHIEAELAQSCVASGVPVPERIDEPFAIRFEREAAASGPDEEVELSSDDCDVIFFAGDRIDMGEAVAETLSLSMNPYPRSPDADSVLREAGVLSEDEASPFAKLRELTRKG